MSLIDNCNKCKVKLSDEEKLQCSKINFIPLCWKCLPYIQAQLKKCQPLFQKLKVL